MGLGGDRGGYRLLVHHPARGRRPGRSRRRRHRCGDDGGAGPARRVAGGEDRRSRQAAPRGGPRSRGQREDGQRDALRTGSRPARWGGLPGGPDPAHTRGESLVHAEYGGSGSGRGLAAGAEPLGALRSPRHSGSDAGDVDGAGAGASRRGCLRQLRGPAQGRERHRGAGGGLRPARAARRAGAGVRNPATGVRALHEGGPHSPLPGVRAPRVPGGGSARGRRDAPLAVARAGRAARRARVSTGHRGL